MQKKRLQMIAWIIVAISIICSLLLWNQRIVVERQYNKVDITAEYWELKNLADANGLTFQELGEMVQAYDVSNVIVKEQSISDLERRGKVEILMGNALTQTNYYGSVSESLQVRDTAVYVAILDKNFEPQVVQYLDVKMAGTTFYSGEVSVVEIPSRMPINDAEIPELLSLVGRLSVGFDWAMVAEVETAGFDIVAQSVWWEDATIQGLELIADEIKTIPNLTYISFGGGATPGHPNNIKEFASFLTVDGSPVAPISVVELSTNTGVDTLVNAMDNNMVRTHTLLHREMSKYDLDTMMDRWMLAIRERNIRNLQVAFFELDTPSVSLEENLIYLETLSSSIEDAGFVLDGTTEQIAEFTPNALLLLVIGFGIAAGLMLVLLQMGLPKLSVVGFVLTVLMWIGLYALSPALARKMMALASVIIFPVLSCLMLVQAQGRTIVKSVLAFVSMCGISMLGAILMAGLLGDALFLMKLDQFIGVKFAHMVPVAVALVLICIWRTKSPLQTTKGILEQAVTYKWAILVLLIAGAGIIYITRTGNSTTEISGIEELMRRFLGNVMGVRPRTKEFLIGYPLTLLLFYYGSKKMNWLLIIPAMIGQVSLVNTYAHLHTPLSISLERSLNGLFLGLVVGLMLWLGCKVCETLLRKWRIIA